MKTHRILLAALIALAPIPVLAQTANLGLVLPTVGADDDAWGTKINTAMTALDAIFVAGGTGTSVGLDVGSGKTLDVTAGTAKFTDSRFTIYDNADATKALKFQIGGFTTATTHTITVPDIDDTLVTLTATQTLTNKTLTSPTISGATLTTPALGAATATSINKITLTAPATGATLTLADGSTLATSGAFSTTLTATAGTNVTLPTTGTLATLAGSETLSNKVLSSPSITSPTYTNASVARTNLGVAIGSNVQAWDADLDALAAMTTPATTLAGAAQKSANLSDLASASTARTNLGLAIGTNVQAWDADLDAVAALTSPATSITGAAQKANNLSDLASASTARTNLGLPLGTSGATVPLLSTANTWTLAQTFTTAPVFTDASGSRTALGLGSLAVKSTVNNGDWSGTALTVANGGTGATTLTGVVKGNGTSAFTAAVAGTDYYAPGGTKVSVADGGTGQGTALAARSVSGLNIESNIGIAGATTTFLSSYRTVSIVSAAAPMTWTLPAASAVNGGNAITILDPTGAISSTNTLTLARAGSDTVNGGTSFLAATAPRSVVVAVSDGASTWTVSTIAPIGTSGAVVPLLNVANTWGALQTFGSAAVGNFLRLPGTGALTIASGVITVTQSFHIVDTEAAAATDDLDTINGGTGGEILILRTQSSVRDVTLKDGTGNLALAGDCTLGTNHDTITLMYVAALSLWIEIARSING